jgi:hypothetical protein
LAAAEPQAPPTLAPAKTYEQDDRLLARLLSLELRDKGTDVEGRGAVGQAGILDGITGGLVVAAAIAKPRAAAPGAPEAAPVETPEARLFAEIAALAPAAAFKSSARLARRTLSFTPHLIDHALLLAALAAPFFLRWSPLGKG